MHLAVRIARILIFAVDHTFIAPIRKIGQRRRPAHIVAQAEVRAVEKVMAAIDVETISEHAGFSVRNILPAGKKRIENLLLHLPAPFCAFSTQVITYFALSRRISVDNLSVRTPGNLHPLDRYNRNAHWTCTITFNTIVSSNKQYDDVHAIIKAFRGLIPYTRMLMSQDGYLIP